MLARLRHLVRHLRSTYAEYHAVAAFKLPALGLLGVIAFPLYYFIWAKAFSAALRELPAEACRDGGSASRWPFGVIGPVGSYRIT